MLEDKLYSISDIAKLTKLTDRTIRNYLANKTLKGVKIGGQWRFTRNDIWALLENDEFEDDMKNITKKKVIDYFDNDKSDNSACIIINLNIKDVNKRIAFFEKVNSLDDTFKKEKISFVDDDGQIKMVVTANTKYIYEILKIIEED